MLPVLHWRPLYIDLLQGTTTKKQENLLLFLLVFPSLEATTEQVAVRSDACLAGMPRNTTRFKAERKACQLRNPKMWHEFPFSFASQKLATVFAPIPPSVKTGLRAANLSRWWGAGEGMKRHRRTRRLLSFTLSLVHTPHSTNLQYGLLWIGIFHWEKIWSVPSGRLKRKSCLYSKNMEEPLVGIFRYPKMVQWV